MANFWLGTYERDKMECFREYLRPGSVVYDVGANVGIYTVLACRMVGVEGRVFSFEPSPDNVQRLAENIRVNKFNNVEIVPSAVSVTDGFATFDSEADPCVRKISESGALRVETVSLDSFVASGKPFPNLMKIDVEGAELDVLRGAQKLLVEHGPTIFLATHGEQVHAECVSFLKELGYGLTFLESDEILARAA